MKEIITTNKKSVLVDEEDYGLLSKFSWTETGGYATHWQKSTAIKRGSQIHRLLLGVSGRHIHIDHINQNPLDNRRINLRIVNMAQNKFNGKKYKRKNGKMTSRFKGVHFNKKIKKYISNIRFNKKLIHLGCYAKEIDAAKAYNEAALEHFGNYSCLNPVS